MHTHDITEAGSRDAETMICLGLGRGALSALTAARIPVFITAESITALALQALAGGKLREAGLEIACGGESHGACGHH